MPDWLTQYVDPENVFIAAGGLAALLGTIWSGVVGIRKGQPTAPAVAAAIAGANCRAIDLKPTLQDIKGALGRIHDAQRELQRDQDRLRELMVRIEDRTRSSSRD